MMSPLVRLPEELRVVIAGNLDKPGEYLIIVVGNMTARATLMSRIRTQVQQLLDALNAFLKYRVAAGYC